MYSLVSHLLRQSILLPRAFGTISQQCQWVLTSFFGPSSLIHMYIKGETCMTYGLKAQFSGINGTIMGTSQI